MDNASEKLNIWIVGASSGIGRDIALQLAQQGHQLIISARREEHLQEIAAQYPINIHPIALDVCDEKQVAQAAESIKGITNSLNIFLYNSGVAQYVSGNEHSYYRTTQKVYDVNFFGFLRCLDVAMPLLKAAQGTKLISAVSSLSSYLPLPRAEAYGSSKAAISYFLNAMRTDLYSQEIDVTVINPGFVDTPMTRKNDFPMPWIWNSSKAASYIVKRILKHPAEIRFPFRLVFVLRCASLLPKKWFARHGQFLVKD